MKESIVFDLDNTLLDTWPRHYKVYCEIVTRRSETPIPYGVYVAMRANYTLSNAQLVQNVHGIVDNIDREWREIIESKEMLAVDTLIVDKDLLDRVAGKYALLLLSLRSNIENAMHQIELCGILKLFTRVQFVAHQAGHNPKTAALQSIKQDFGVRCFVGDSKSDLEAATGADLPFVMVGTGLYRCQEKVRQYPTVNHFLLETTNR